MIFARGLLENCTCIARFCALSPIFSNTLNILKIKVESDTISAPKLGKQPNYKNVKLIDAACSNIENQTCISLVNKSPNKKIIVKLPKYKKIIENYVINGNSPTDLNTQLDRNKIKIKKK